MEIHIDVTSGGDGIPVELSQILKDDAVKVLHSICQHIWKNVSYLEVLQFKFVSTFTGSTKLSGIQ